MLIPMEFGKKYKYLRVCPIEELQSDMDEHIQLPFDNYPILEKYKTQGKTRNYETIDLFKYREEVFQKLAKHDPLFLNVSEAFKEKIILRLSGNISKESANSLKNGGSGFAHSTFSILWLRVFDSTLHKYGKNIDPRDFVLMLKYKKYRDMALAVMKKYGYFEVAKLNGQEGFDLSKKFYEKNNKEFKEVA